jgi:hypothetical protein
VCKAAFAGNAAPEKFIIFSGVDIWRYGAFAHGGLIWSPGGLDNDGFTFKALLSGGTYRYISGALGNTEVTGRELAAQFSPGWHFKFAGGLELRVFAGFDIQDHRLSPDDPSSGLRGQDYGVRAAFDLWYEPTPLTMVAIDGSVSSIDHQYSVRGAVGMRAFDWFYLGPEVQRFNSEGYQQTRLGIHVTAFRTSIGEWSAAAGWGTDTGDRDGPYMRVGWLTRR